MPSRMRSPMSHTTMPSYTPVVPYSPPAGNRRTSAIIRMALGAVLLAAAGVKYYDGPSQPGTVFASPHLRTFVLLAETGCGLWLVLGRPTRGQWLSALALFTALGATSLFMAL